MQSQAASDSEWWPIGRVMRETGLARATIYRRMSAGTFPRNHQMRSTRRSVWIEAEVRAWKRDELTDVIPAPVPAPVQGIGDLL